MRTGFKVVLVVVCLVLGFVSGVMWQANFPLLGDDLGKLAGQQSRGVTTLSGNLAGVVLGAGNVEVYYERPFASPPALTFTKPEKGLFSFEVIEQRADGFKIRVSAISTDEYPRWEAKGRPAAD